MLGAMGSDPSIGIVTLNDPARMNAMTEEMAIQFSDRISRLAELKVDAIVVTGNGRAFSAGGDMEMMRRKQKQTAEKNSEEMLAFYRSFLGILKLNIPIVAAINGAAIGAGLCFACACDRRVAAGVDKNILGFSFAKLGLAPGMGGTIFPERLIGKERADDMLAKAYNVTPRQALEMGMVEMVVSPKSVMEYSYELAIKLAGNSRKALSRRVGYWKLKSALEEEARLQGASFLTQRHKRLYDIYIRDLKSRSKRMS